MIFLIRHGESFDNKNSIFSGYQNSNLTDLGKEQILGTAEILKKEEKEFTIFSSKLNRTKESAIIIKNHLNIKSDIIYDKLLEERNYGILTGEKHSSMEEKFGKQQIFKWRRNLNCAPPGGESLLDVVKRVESFYKKYSILKSKNHFIIVAHGNIIKSFLYYFMKIQEKDIESILIKNGEIIPIFF